MWPASLSLCQSTSAMAVQMHWQWWCMITVSHSLRPWLWQVSEWHSAYVLVTAHASEGMKWPDNGHLFHKFNGKKMNVWVCIKESKVLPEPYAHRAALISVPLALSHTPAYTAKTADTGPVHRAVCPFTARWLGWYQIIHGCEQLAQSCYLIVPRLGIELTTSRSRVQCPNHYTTKPSWVCIHELYESQFFFKFWPSLHIAHTHTTVLRSHQKGKTNLDFLEQEIERQWHQLGHMQSCTLSQTHKHATIPSLSFLQAGCPSCCPTNSIKALKVYIVYECDI